MHLSILQIFADYPSHFLNRDGHHFCCTFQKYFRAFHTLYYKIYRIHLEELSPVLLYILHTLMHVLYSIYQNVLVFILPWTPRLLSFYIITHFKVSGLAKCNYIFADWPFSNRQISIFYAVVVRNISKPSNTPNKRHLNHNCVHGCSFEVFINWNGFHW